jgi:hypothetical protein
MSRTLRVLTFLVATCGTTTSLATEKAPAPLSHDESVRFACRGQYLGFPAYIQGIRTVLGTGSLGGFVSFSGVIGSGEVSVRFEYNGHSLRPPFGGIIHTPQVPTTVNIFDGAQMIIYPSGVYLSAPRPLGYFSCT